MAIRRLRLENFKSFRQLDLKLGGLNVLIGANASGKSNLVQALRFIQDIRSQGLDNAISQQGGIEYLANVAALTQAAGAPEGSRLGYEVLLDAPIPRIFLRTPGPLRLRLTSSEYGFQLRFTGSGSGYAVADEFVRSSGELVRLEVDTPPARGKEVSVPVEIEVGRTNGTVEPPVVRVPDTAELRPDELSFQWLPEGKVKPDSLALLGLFSLAPFTFADRSLVSVYDIDPSFSKESIPITGKADLDTDGRNLAIVLKRIRENEEDWRKLSNLVKDLLPFVQDLDVQRLADKSLLFQLKEEFAPGVFLPAPLISDGTINVIALIIALYFDRSDVTIIEEPERNIHPHLIRQLLTMAKEVSQRKQIVITTHNPEVVKHAGLEHLLLVSRDANGGSVVSRPADLAHLQTFLANQIGIDELYVQDLLKV